MRYQSSLQQLAYSAALVLSLVLSAFLGPVAPVIAGSRFRSNASNSQRGDFIFARKSRMRQAAVSGIVNQATSVSPQVTESSSELTFDVATIKPNDSGLQFMKGFDLEGRRLVAHNASLLDLVTFIYKLHPNQIKGAPEWFSTARYDINAMTDKDGLTSSQLNSMVKSLLAERFNLKFHNEKELLAAYEITSTSRTHANLTHSTQPPGRDPSYRMESGSGAITLRLRAVTLADFANYLQAFVLDKAVVNNTDLDGKYDLTLKFTAEDGQFHGRPPVNPEATDSSIDLFAAMREQLGLTLKARRIFVDGFHIDHVDRPSPN